MICFAGKARWSAISEQKAPGLYQVVFVHRFDGTFKQLLVQHMPLPEIAFLSKVLKLNLPGITVRMALGRLDGDALNEALVPKGETKMAVYRAVFPFKSLHLVHESQPSTGFWVVRCSF